MNGGNAAANANGALTRAEMQTGFDNQTIFNKLNGLENGLSDGFYAQNTTMLNGFAGTQAALANGFAGTNAAIANSTASLIQAVDNQRFAQQQCCCETNRNIDAVRYEAAQNTSAIMQADSQNTQKILDAITGNRMADMQNQINQLQLQSALCNVVRYPNNFSYNAGPSPFCGGCGCGNI